MKTEEMGEQWEEREEREDGREEENNSISEFKRTINQLLDIH
jgi:hypothetical protein